MSIKSVRIKFFNKVALGGVYIEDQKKDTLLYANEITVAANFLDALNNKLDFRSIEIKDFVANIDRKDKKSPHNFQFVIDAFTPKKKKPKDPNKTPFGLTFDDVRLTNGTVKYLVLSSPETPGMFNPDRLFFRNLSLRASAGSIDPIKLDAKIHKMDFWEHAGIKVENLVGFIRTENKKLMSNRIGLTLNNSDLRVTSAVYNLKTKEFSLRAKSERIEPKDAAIFSNRFMHLTKPFQFEADFLGKLPYLDVKNLKAFYGDGTYIEIVGLMSDLKRYADSDLNIDIKRLRTNPDDLQSLIRIGSKDYQLTKQLRALGNIDLSLSVRGKFSRFVYKGNIKTQQGSLQLNGKGSADKEFQNYTFEGPVKTQNLRLKRILGPKSNVDIDDATLSIVAKVVKRKGRPFEFSGRGNVASVMYKGAHYRNISFNGSYSQSNIRGFVAMNDGVNNFNLKANIRLKNNLDIDVKGNIHKLYLKPFLMRPNWENPYLTTRIDAHLSGKNIDNILGKIVMDSTQIVDKNFIYNPGPIQIEALRDSVGENRIELMSSFMEATIAGNYHFATIGKEVTQLLDQHLPTLINSSGKVRGLNPQNQFTFGILLKNTEDFSYAFALPFYNIEPGRINGNANLANSEVTVDAYLKRLMYGNNDIRESKINLFANQDTGIKLNVNTYLVQNNGYVNAHLNSLAYADSISNSLTYDVSNSSVSSSGEILANLDFLRSSNNSLETDINLYSSNAKLNQKDILIQPSQIRLLKGRIEVNKFGIRHGDMLLLGIDGTASQNINDELHIYFNDTELEPILTALNINNINGIVNGDLIVQRALKDPLIHTNNLQVDRVQIYKDTIGTLVVNGDMAANYSGLNLDSYLIKDGKKYLSINGFVPTSKESEAMNVDILMEDLPLKWVQPFAESTFSKMDGTINSKIKATGNTKSPITEGWLGIDNGLMQVAYTNVSYTITDTIQINRDNIGLNDLIIRDDNGHTANLTLTLNQTNYGKMSYNVKLRMNDFLLLNNNERTNEQVHGNLKLSGTVDLKGTPNGIFGTTNLYNESESEVNIELPQTASANKYNGVIYINTTLPIDSMAFLKKNAGADEQINTRVSSGIPINIRGKVTLDPRINIGVLINPTTGDAISIKGDGQLDISYDSKSDPSFLVFGDYVAQDGSVNYNLQSLKNVKFRLREGSKLSFLGDPKKTNFQIVAYNRVKADLTTLSETFKESSLASTRVPVDAILDIQGNLEKLLLNYDIELPDASNDIKQKVNSLINTDEVRIRQFAYLVTTGNFYHSSGTPEMLFTDKMFTSFAANALSKGLDALFAAALADNWTINTNLETDGGNFDNVRMGVDVSGKFLDDKLRVTTNLSYGDSQNYARQQAFLGEFELEYDVYNWLMLRAYNRANEKFYKRAPYTQGVGVVVKKDSKRFKDLFKFRIKKSNKENLTPKTDSIKN